MRAGETFFGFDFGGHLWIILSGPDHLGRIVVVSLTTHGRARFCGDHCIVLQPGSHPFVTRETCVVYEKAALASEANLDDAKERRELRQHAPVEPALLRRIQRGAAESKRLPPALREVVRAALDPES